MEEQVSERGARACSNQAQAANLAEVVRTKLRNASGGHVEEALIREAVHAAACAPIDWASPSGFARIVP